MPEVQLDVNVTNSAARAAYERYGFVGTGSSSRSVPARTSGWS